MPMPVSRKAEKCFRASESFRRLTELPTEYSGLFEISAGEEIVGLYFNHPESHFELVLITQLGIRLAQNHGIARLIPYVDMAKIDWQSDKSDVLEEHNKRQLIITLRSGELVYCPVRGEWHDSKDGTSAPDIANFHTFLLGARQISKIMEKKE